MAALRNLTASAAALNDTDGAVNPKVVNVTDAVNNGEVSECVKVFFASATKPSGSNGDNVTTVPKTPTKPDIPECDVIALELAGEEYFAQKAKADKKALIDAKINEAKQAEAAKKFEKSQADKAAEDAADVKKAADKAAADKAAAEKAAAEVAATNAAEIANPGQDFTNLLNAKIKGARKANAAPAHTDDQKRAYAVEQKRLAAEAKQAAVEAKAQKDAEAKAQKDSDDKQAAVNKAALSASRQLKEMDILNKNVADKKAADKQKAATRQAAAAVKQAAAAVKQATEDAEKKAKEDADKKAHEDAAKKAHEDATKQAATDKKAKEDAVKKQAVDDKNATEVATRNKVEPASIATVKERSSLGYTLYEVLNGLNEKPPYPQHTKKHNEHKTICVSGFFSDSDSYTVFPKTPEQIAAQTEAATIIKFHLRENKHVTRYYYVFSISFNGDYCVVAFFHKGTIRGQFRVNMKKCNILEIPISGVRRKFSPTWTSVSVKTLIDLLYDCFDDSAVSAVSASNVSNDHAAATPPAPAPAPTEYNRDYPEADLSITKGNSKGNTKDKSDITKPWGSAVKSTPIPTKPETAASIAEEKSKAIIKLEKVKAICKQAALESIQIEAAIQALEDKREVTDMEERLSLAVNAAANAAREKFYAEEDAKKQQRLESKDKAST